MCIVVTGVNFVISFNILIPITISLVNNDDDDDDNYMDSTAKYLGVYMQSKYVYKTCSQFMLIIYPVSIYNNNAQPRIHPGE